MCYQPARTPAADTVSSHGRPALSELLLESRHAVVLLKVFRETRNGMRPIFFVQPASGEGQ